MGNAGANANVGAKDFSTDEGRGADCRRRCVTSHRPEGRGRRSTRLKGYDYASEGAYFITIVTRRRECLFGEVVQGTMRLNEAGRVTESCWLGIPDHFPHAALDAFVVMPNHVHGIVVITGPVVGANANVGAMGNAGANASERFFAPTECNGVAFAIEDHRFNCSRFQNRRHQMVPVPYQCLLCVAAQLLRTRRPR